MSEEQTEATPQVDTSNAEIESLKAQYQEDVKGLDRKNQDLLRKLQKVKQIPDGVDVEELIEFKRKSEQNKLEAKGDYEKARASLEQQFREATAEKDKQIADLKARVKELELVTPALSALAEVVHDTDYALNKLGRDNFEVEKDGTVVYVDGYERTPIQEAAKKKLGEWALKQTAPKGGGAPTGKSSGGGIPAGTKNPFLPESFNLTEQSRLFQRDRDMYERLKTAAGR